MRLRRLFPAIFVLTLATTSGVAANGATPATPVAVRSLLAFTLPAAVVPSPAEIVFGVSTWSPGAANTALVAPAGAGFDYVVAGALAVRSAGPLLVARAGAPPQPMPVGTEIMLGAGDAAVYLDLSAPSVVRNAGDGPVSLVYLTVQSLAPSSALNATPVSTGAPGLDAIFTHISVPVGDIYGFLTQRQFAELEGRAVAVELARATVAPGATLPALLGPGRRLAGTPGIPLGQAGLLNDAWSNDGPAPLVLDVLTLRPGDEPAGPAATPGGPPG